MQNYLKPLLAAYLLAFSYATAWPQDAQPNQEDRNQAPPSSMTISEPTSISVTAPMTTITTTTGDSSINLAAESKTTAASLPKSTGTTYTVYNASLTDNDGPTPSYQFHLVCSGAKPGAALISCDGQWKREDSWQANHLTCTNKNVDVAVIFVGMEMDVHITLK